MSGGSGKNTGDGHLIWSFLLTCTTIGIVVRYICTRLNLQIPYTSILLVIFTILGLVQLGDSELDASSNAFAAFDPDLLQYIFLPLLCLETTLDIDVRNFIRLFPVILLLLVPGLAITAVLTAVLVDYGMPAYEWDFVTCLMLASVLTATDTMPIVQAMRKAGVSERLASIIEGESILVDCLSFILVSVFRSILLTSDSTSLIDLYEDPGDVDYSHEIGVFSQELFGAVLFGIGLGMVIVFFLYRVINDALVEISTLLVASYGSFFVGTHYLHVNGNLAVVAMLLYFCQWERHTISPTVLPALHAVVESLSYIAVTLVYAIAGVMASYYMFASDVAITGTDVGYCIALYFFLHLTRAVACFLLLPIIRALGYKLNYKDVLMISYSGVRGVQTLVLMLIVVLTPEFTVEVSHRIGFQVCGIVLLTNTFNASAARWVFDKLGLKPDTPESRLVLLATIDQLKSDGDAKINLLKKSPNFEAANWSKVEQLLQDSRKSAAEEFNQTTDENENRSILQAARDHVASFRTFSSSLLSPRSRMIMNHPSSDSEADSSSTTADVSITVTPRNVDANEGTRLADVKQRDDLTERFLGLQRTEYYRLYDSGCLSRAATIILMESINASLDRRDLSQQWKVIESHLKVPTWLSWLYSSTRLRSVRPVRWLIDQQVFLHLCVSLEVSSAFCGAEAKLSEFLQSFPVLSSINQAAMDDMQREAAVYARKAAESFADIKSAFPAVHASVHSKHAALTMLNSQESTLHHLHDSGLLSKAEYERLHEIVEHRYVTMKRKRPENNMEATEDIFCSQPLVTHLQTVQREWLLAHSQRLLLPPNQWVAGGNEGEPGMTRNQPPGVYMVIRGQVTVYHEEADVPIAAKPVEGGWATVHPCPLSDPSAPRGSQQRVGVGALLSARSLIDGEMVWCKTVTASEVLYVPAVEMRRALTEPHAEAQLMRAAAADTLKSAYSHLPAGKTADVTDELVTLATFYSMQTGSSDASNHTTRDASRVMLLVGRIDVKSKSGASVSVEAPALIELRDRASLVPSLDARWIEWQAGDEQKAAVKVAEKKERNESTVAAERHGDHPNGASVTRDESVVENGGSKGVYSNGDVELSTLSYA